MQWEWWEAILLSRTLCVYILEMEGRREKNTHLEYVLWEPLLFTAYPQLSEKDLETITKYAGDDPVVKQFIIYASRAKCVRECKARRLSPTQRYPDTVILNRFKLREPYSFLHYAYYQVRGEV